MERGGESGNPSEQSQPFDRIHGESPSLSSTLFLDHVGEVTLVFNPDGLAWKLVESSDQDQSLCLGIKRVSIVVTELRFSDVYAVELVNYGTVHSPNRAKPRRLLSGHGSEMYRFSVHGFEKSKAAPSVWSVAAYTFGHKDQRTCEMWGDRIKNSLNLESGRPKNLMVFIHPRSGKGNGCKVWETVAPIFSHAKVKTKVIVTQRAGQAFDEMSSISNKELNLYDGVVTVGGDGFFNEILNGFLQSRHKSTYPPAPSDSGPSVELNGKSVAHEDRSPLLPSPTHGRLGPSDCRSEDASCSTDQDPEFLILNERIRFGIIPAGSTDAIVMCTTGVRDPVTSALQIVLGKKVKLDLAQVVRWKITSTSKVVPCVRYAASFAGYGFYGDVITESEKLRWMGPKRYDYAGTKVFLKHRSYEAEIAYLQDNSTAERESASKVNGTSTSGRVICRVNCKVCGAKPSHANKGEARWVKSKGRYLSVGAAIISNRNERAPDGLVADAHLSDGLLHLILIKDCPHAFYLWHLTQLARKGGKPLDFKFVEHHKTPMFTFTSGSDESVWNLDGEMFQAHQLSAQVFRGLVSLFATGPEV